MQVKDWKAWTEECAAIATMEDWDLRRYAACILDYAVAWAEEMEKRIADGDVLATLYKDVSHDVDRRPQFGITGNMYGLAVSLLSKHWVHGEDLRKAHNAEYGQPDAPPGAVVNPAMVSISIPDDQ